MDNTACHWPAERDTGRSGKNAEIGATGTDGI